MIDSAFVQSGVKGNRYGWVDNIIISRNNEVDDLNALARGLRDFRCESVPDQQGLGRQRYCLYGRQRRLALLRFSLCPESLMTTYSFF